MSVLKELDTAILRELVEYVLSHNYDNGANLTYKALAESIHKKTGADITPQALKPHLFNIAMFCMPEDKPQIAPVITAVVVKTKTLRPGKGFFTLFDTTPKNEKIWMSELKSIYSYDNWNEILELAQTTDR